jgi:CHAD domain-containing protein
MTAARASESSKPAAAATLGETAYEVLRVQFAEFLARAPGTRLGENVEELHAMRVASRRLRAALRLFRDALPKRAERLRDELAWTAAALGEVRDLDVEAEQFSSWSRRDPRLRAAAVDAALHSEARRRLLDTLDSPRFSRFVDRFGEFLAKGPPKRNAAAATPVVAAAPALVRRLRKKVRAAAARLAPDSPPEVYHELRIRGKRLRYALEFLEGVYGDDAAELARRIADLQEILGRHQDASVAMDRVERRLAADVEIAPTAAFAMGVVVERCSQEAARMREEFPKAYARTQGRPWRRLKRRMERMRPEEGAGRAKAAGGAGNERPDRRPPVRSRG